MLIREATIKDAEEIKQLHLRAFTDLEADLVADLAVKLLQEQSAIKTISLVATDNELIIGHAAFSPVFLARTEQHFGYILAPLAVLPAHQHNRVGSTIVKHGLDTISSCGAVVVFVYGDPQYYSRFGFTTDLAQHFTPPYSLQYPEGWQAVKINSPILPQAEKLRCVDSLNDPRLW